MDISLFITFCASFFLIALSPGLCMTLAMSLGIGIGVRRSLWMMLGELSGVGLVAIATLAGVSGLLLNAPKAFAAAKLVGAAYLLWSAQRTWREPVQLVQSGGAAAASRRNLVSQGFLTAVANPKAWVFFAALLPPFIDPQKPLLLQAGMLLVAMLVIEFGCLLIYAQGGRMLRTTLTERGLGQWLNRIAASLMAAVALWLVLA